MISERRPAHTIDRVAIVIPARDEAGSIGGALRALARAVARVDGLARCHVAVVDDGSTDGTGPTARGLVGDLFADGRVIRTDVGCVGAARRIGVGACTAAWDRPEHAWLLSTDADSTVGTDWIVRHLRHARRGVCAVSGIVDIADDAAAVPFRSAWRADYTARIGADRVHPYAHATNLGIRLDAYRAVGGFRDLAGEEDADLWRRLRARGIDPVADARIVVATSGRRRGRVPYGFAHALATAYP